MFSQLRKTRSPSAADALPGRETAMKVAETHYFTAEQRQLAENSRDAYQAKLAKAKLATISTEILLAPPFYYAEDYHQQYLAKNPGGYCGIGYIGIPLDDDISTT